MTEKLEKVVKDVTTKKKYVKPDFEVIELNMEAPLLSASGDQVPNSDVTLDASSYSKW